MTKSDKMPDESEQPTLTEKKYSRETICNPKKIRKGVTRWNQFSERLLELYPQARKGPILDFGSGIGYFVLEGLRRKLDIWGVDLLPGKIQRFQKLIEHTKSPEHWKNHCLAANGEELPFPKDTFTAVSSWYVFEHIPNPGQCIREMVRVTRPGGIVAIRAQDARNGWEGHCKIPWIPFLPERLALAWMEEFEVDPTLREDVFEITQSQIAAILEEFNCRVVVQAEPPRQLIDGQHELSTESDVRGKARQIRQDYENGKWHPQPENLYVYARKVA